LAFQKGILEEFGRGFPPPERRRRAGKTERRAGLGGFSGGFRRVLYGFKAFPRIFFKRSNQGLKLFTTFQGVSQRGMLL
jgi:hypothetical protein